MVAMAERITNGAKHPGALRSGAPAGAIVPSLGSELLLSKWDAAAAGGQCPDIPAGKEVVERVLFGRHRLGMASRGGPRHGQEGSCWTLTGSGRVAAG